MWICTERVERSWVKRNQYCDVTAGRRLISPLPSASKSKSSSGSNTWSVKLDDALLPLSLPLSSLSINLTILDPLEPILGMMTSRRRWTGVRTYRRGIERLCGSTLSVVMVNSCLKEVWYIHLHDVRGLHDAHRTRILRVTLAWHMRQIHVGCARVISANPKQMLRAPAARGARNKGCYFTTTLYMYIYTVKNNRIFTGCPVASFLP
jgi:hypothetical protein